MIQNLLKRRDSAYVKQRSFCFLGEKSLLFLFRSFKRLFVKLLIESHNFPSRFYYLHRSLLRLLPNPILLLLMNTESSEKDLCKQGIFNIPWKVHNYAIIFALSKFQTYMNWSQIQLVSNPNPWMYLKVYLP